MWRQAAGLLEGAVPACWRGKKWKLLLCKTGYKQAKGVPFQRFPFYKLKYSFCVFLSLCRCISLETPDEYEHIGLQQVPDPRKNSQVSPGFCIAAWGERGSSRSEWSHKENQKGTVCSWHEEQKRSSWQPSGMYEVTAQFNPLCLLRVREMALSLVSMYFPEVDAYAEDSFQKAE